MHDIPKEHHPQSVRNDLQLKQRPLTEKGSAGAVEWTVLQGPVCCRLRLGELGCARQPCLCPCCLGHDQPIMKSFPVAFELICNRAGHLLIQHLYPTSAHHLASSPSKERVDTWGSSPILADASRQPKQLFLQLRADDMIC